MKIILLGSKVRASIIDALYFVKWYTGRIRTYDLWVQARYSIQLSYKKAVLDLD